MIRLKNSKEIELMRRAGKIAAGALRTAGNNIRPGVTTRIIDIKIRDYIERNSAIPSFKGYNGFPGNSCISLNHEVIHGIPSDRKLKDGDIVKIDIGAIYKGYHGDCADTFYVGDGTAMPRAIRQLIDVTRECFWAGVSFALPKQRIGDISSAIQGRAELGGFSVVRQWTGHGIGAKLHEDPEVPNFGTPGKGKRLSAGMTIAIEPMVNAGTFEVDTLPDKWTVVTADGSLSAHYEHTVLIRDGSYELLTLMEV
jgi:methionyl aminopeptidase